MEWTLIAFLVFLISCFILIIITLMSLPKLGDERKEFIKIKAQSYTFTVVIGYALVEIGRSVYKNIWSDSSYPGINPFIFLVAISVIYLISLLFSKKKYGKNFMFKLATCAFENFAVIENTFLYAVVSNFISLLNASLAVRYPNILRGRLFIHCWIFLIV